ncbi:MAG: Trk family potassium uptake protein [candidate division WOR-3 bacterium]|nr:MAG: Trk family potassium uptake protein [candidate division WOR-3 bacterium]
MFGKREINAPRILIGGYLGIIAVGTVLLMLPASTRSGISFIDSLFTASSALCVTGLIVKNTALDFTLFGKCVLLTLIQIGGLGYMTLSTTFFFFIGRKISLRDRLLFKESVNLLTYENLRRFAWRVFRITIVVEVVGTALLYFTFVQKFSAPAALGHAFFHAVSAFCNAGFSTFSENMAMFSSSVSGPMVVSLLFIFGGIGFVVISDLYTTLVKREKKRLALHTTIVLRATLALIVIGTAFIFFIEYDRGLTGLPIHQKLLTAFFHAVTPRTAGFNTMSIALFSPITIMLLLVFMFIGASPGGTGGGIKTTTFVLLFRWAKDLMLGRYGKDVIALKKRIPIEQAFRAFLIFLLSGSTIVVAFLLILLIDKQSPLKVLFEVFSAFGTVGLSMGSSLNPFCSFSFDLSALSKLVIIGTLIAGRVGTITLGSAILKPHPLEYTYPEEPIVVG